MGQSPADETKGNSARLPGFTINEGENFIGSNLMWQCQVGGIFICRADYGISKRNTYKEE
jgi:hypothetical protein